MKEEPLPPDEDAEEAAEVAEELDEAVTDEAPTDVTAPELNAQTRNLTEWDEPPMARGTAAPKVEPDDDDSVASKLVYEGEDEAEREKRMAAADPDYEP